MKYRLKTGHTHYHFVDEGKDENGVPRGRHIRLEAGEVVELTPNQAKSFADRFEPVGQGLKTESAGERSGAPAGASESAGFTAEKLAALNAEEVGDVVAGAEDGDLAALEGLEKAGKNRKGVLQAIEARRKELAGA